jgi:predicted transcriptional regulator
MNGQMLRLAADVVSTYVRSNPLPPSELALLLRDVHDAMKVLSYGTSVVAAEHQKPAVSIKKSITPDYIVCLEDGKKLKMLKRYLHSRYGLSPAEYRAKWHLPAGYPMVAPNYSEQRSEFAKKIGLGRTATKRRGRRKAK